MEMPNPTLDPLGKGRCAVFVMASVFLLAATSLAGEKIYQDPAEIASIRDLLHRYSFFIDDARGDEFEELFTKEAVFNVLDLSLHGRKTIRKAAGKLFERELGRGLEQLFGPVPSSP
jgi:hypothetical protein